MTQINRIDHSEIQNWISFGLDEKSIRENLVKMDLKPDTIEAYINEYNKLKIVKRQRIAFFLLGGGSLIGFISCILTLTNPFPELHSLFLYGLTSIAILVTFFGLYFLFE